MLWHTKSVTTCLTWSHKHHFTAGLLTDLIYICSQKQTGPQLVHPNRPSAGPCRWTPSWDPTCTDSGPKRRRALLLAVSMIKPHRWVSVHPDIIKGVVMSQCKDEWNETRIGWILECYRPLKSVAARCRTPAHRLLCGNQTHLRSASWVVSLFKISDVGSAGVWWFQLVAACWRQPSGTSCFCSSRTLLFFPPPSTVSASNWCTKPRPDIAKLCGFVFTPDTV